MNIKCFPLVDNPITPLLYLSVIILNFICLLLPHRLQKSSKFIDVHSQSHKNEIFSFRSFSYLGSYLLTFLPLIFGEL